jgi:hypothetical protein
MAIPATELFEEFIAKSRVVERPSGTETLLSMAVGQPSLYLEYPEAILAPDSMPRVISRELSEKGCAAPRNVAIAVLAAIVSTIEPGHVSRAEIRTVKPYPEPIIDAATAAGSALSSSRHLAPLA